WIFSTFPENLIFHPSFWSDRWFLEGIFASYFIPLSPSSCLWVNITTPGCGDIPVSHLTFFLAFSRV
ncbi:hypothetical protein ONS95_003807, partial [Cadophora gregata]|uniref:uncharacterized protein n=1 Tax=Cadophora gregata TaxID=51156 RepID=UPI0026DB7615